MEPLNKRQQAAYDLALAASHRAIGSSTPAIGDPLDIDWGFFLYFIDLNGLAGAVQHAISSLPADQRFRIPFRVSIAVRNLSDRYRERWLHHESILEEINERADERMKIVLLKGASFKSTIYRDFPDIRVMGDIDLLVSSNQSDELLGWVTEWGFDTRQSKNGITAIRNAKGKRTVIDVHIDDPAKTKRNPSKSIRTLLDNLLPSARYPKLCMPSLEYSMAHCCKHFCEHKDDFRKVLFQDDIKVSRLLDIMLLEKASDPVGTRTLAESLGWHEELDRALGYIDAIRPGGPRRPDLQPESIDTPVGAVPWPVGFDELLKRVDRAEWLSSQLGDGGSRDLWYSPEKGILNPAQKMQT